MIRKKSAVALATLAFAAATLFPVQAQAVDVKPNNVSKISGSQSCPSGQRVYVTFSSNSGYSTLQVNGKTKGTSSSIYVYDTGLRSATWNVTGANIDYAKDYCRSGPFGNGGGGSF